MRAYSYSQNSAQANCMAFEDPAGRIFYFSYKTCVAFSVPGEPLVVSENIWGPTTGKHINWISADKSKRLPRAEFEKALARLSTPPRSSHQENREYIEKIIKDLRETPCSFFACEGPDAPYTAMKTCSICGAVKDLETMLES